MSTRRAVLIWIAAMVVVGLMVIVGPRNQPSRLTRLEPDGLWFAFEYPRAWRVIHEYKQAGEHGPAVFAAVGIGEFDLGCTETPNSVTCPDAPSWTVPADGVVVAYRSDPICCVIQPQPSPMLGEGERLDAVDGMPAIYSETPNGATWHLFEGGPVYIEARWGDQAPPGTRAAVIALVASWEWIPPPN
jgi:hypothetical protein